MKQSRKDKVEDMDSKKECLKTAEGPNDEVWSTEEVLRVSNLLQKVKAWDTFNENKNKCPICEREFQEGDLSTTYVVPMHTKCLARLRAKIILEKAKSSTYDRKSTPDE